MLELAEVKELQGCFGEALSLLDEILRLQRVYSILDKRKQLLCDAQRHRGTALVKLGRVVRPCIESPFTSPPKHRAPPLACGCTTCGKSTERVSNSPTSTRCPTRYSELFGTWYRYRVRIV